MLKFLIENPLIGIVVNSSSIQRLYALHLPFITSRAFRQIMGHEERFEGAQDLNLTEQLQILDLPCLQGVTRNTITLISALRKQV